MKGVCLEHQAPRDGVGHHPNTDPHRTAQPQHGRVALCMVFVAPCVIMKRVWVASLCLCVSVCACMCNRRHFDVSMYAIEPLSTVLCC